MAECWALTPDAEGSNPSPVAMGGAMDRREQLNEIFRNVDNDERQLVDKLIGEVLYLEKQMEDLKKLPFIAIHPEKPQLQKMTPAAKLYKEMSQAYMNAIRILVNVLRKVEASAQDDLLKMLEEYK